MSKFSATQRNLLYAELILALVCIVFGAIAWTATSSPAMGLGVAPTPAYARSFAFAEIAKPTYAAPPTVIPTATQIPTATLAPFVQVETLQDTPMPEYAAPNYQVASGYGGNKYILVDISEQHMYVYEGEALVYSFVSSTGMNNATRAGTFSVLDKIPNAYGATWDIWMPNWLGIYWAGSMENGIHALPILSNGGTLWAGYLGIPISYGCVVLGTYEAQLLYDWADIGTPVEIQW
jgi:lipoprotein-anchoring transpeptidase ErfK/SrfK